MCMHVLGSILLAASLAAPAGARPDVRIGADVSAGPPPGGPVPEQAADRNDVSQVDPLGAKKPKDKEGNAGVRLVWNDRPSLWIGNMVRVDVRVKVQGDFRGSQGDLAAHGGTFELSRRRAGVKGTFLRWFEYEVEHDLAKDGEWRDVYLNFRPTAGVQVQAGKFKIPFSQEALTGATDLDFIYRSLAAEGLAPGRGVGVMAHGRLLKRGLHYEAGVFRHDGSNAPQVRAVFPDPERTRCRFRTAASRSA
jgi:hypothetical protein